MANSLATRQLRVGYDLDGFGYDFVADAADIAVEHFGVHRSTTSSVSQWDLFEVWGINQGEFWEAAEHYTATGRMWRRPPVEGWVESISALRLLGHSVHVATARPKFSAHTTSAWLSRFCCGVESLHLITDKSAVAFDVFVDDYPANLDAVRAAHPDTLTILWDQPWNREDTGHLRLSEWTELVETISGWCESSPIPTLVQPISVAEGARKLGVAPFSKAG